MVWLVPLRKNVLFCRKPVSYRFSASQLIGSSTFDDSVCPSIVSTDYLFPDETPMVSTTALRFKRVFMFSTLNLPLLKYESVKCVRCSVYLFPSVPKVMWAEERALALWCPCCRSVLHGLVFDQNLLTYWFLDVDVAIYGALYDNHFYHIVEFLGTIFHGALLLSRAKLESFCDVPAFRYISLLKHLTLPNSVLFLTCLAWLYLSRFTGSCSNKECSLS